MSMATRAATIRQTRMMPAFPAPAFVHEVGGSAPAATGQLDGKP